MLTVAQIAERVNAGTTSATEVEAALARCAGDTRNAIIRTHAAHARARIAEVDAAVKAGQRLPLAGVPVVIKDNLCLTGAEVGCCSKILSGFIAPYTATAVQRLEAAGAIVVATANMDEFAMGSSNETSCHGPVQHPLDPERVPGGSSGGSACSVASGLVPLALGSDTGGSIRQPASLCGVVGFKPSYGSVSRYGLIAFGSSLDQIGPFAADVEGARRAFVAMSGHDPLDSTSSPRAWPVEAAADPTAVLRGLRVGWCPAHVDGLDAGVRARLEAAKQALVAAGATLVEIGLPHEKYAVAVYYVIATGEASSNFARFDGVRYGPRAAEPKDLHDLYARTRAQGFGPEVRRRIFLGTYVLSTGYYDAYYKKAQQVRRLICADYDAAFARCDVILGPASPDTAFKRGAKSANPLQMYLSDVFTIATNLAGVPGISVPFGADAQGLPVGMQLQAALGADAKLMQVAAALEALAAR
jgi:aspartyl-tRNA(Asn)/glutamyl-tRNA(Gln) amidotransferase subunit A